MNNAILPMPPFEWQKEIWQEYYGLVCDDRLPHAFLLAGQEGIGLESLSLAMGQYLLCNSPLKGIACGKCKGCQLLSAGTHPDLFVVRPEEKAKQIKVDQIRSVASFVAKTAQQGGFKVVILEPTEAMNLNAANALLKSLEEPAGKTVFFLLSFHVSRVLPTIRSRCAKYLLKPPKEEQALEWLSSVGLDDAESILFEAMNAPLLAKEWHENGTAEKRIDIISDLVKIADKALEPLAFANKWGKEEPISVISPMMRCLEVVLANKLARRAFPTYYRDVEKALSHSSSSILFRLLDQLKGKKSQILFSPNLNGMLFVEELALDWAAVVTKR